MKNMALFDGRPHLLARQYYILAGDSRKAGDLAAARRYLALARKTHPARPAPLGDVALRRRPEPGRPVPRPPERRTGPRAEPAAGRPPGLPQS